MLPITRLTPLWAAQGFRAWRLAAARDSNYILWCPNSVLYMNNMASINIVLTVVPVIGIPIISTCEE